MSSKIIQPELGAKSFSCPVCGAVAHQTWYKLYLKGFEQDEAPRMLRPDAVQALADRNISEDLKDYVQKRLAKEPFEHCHEQSESVRWQLENVWTSECFSCKAWSIWVADRLVYPHQKYAVEPNAEMPDEVKRDFLEAAAVVDISARAAAALLRLCVQKLVIILGENGDNLNQDIGNLVSKGIITTRIQQALDVVRVVGNNAVHPGELDLRDDRTIALNLFGLVNVIVEATIGTPKHIKSIYETVVPEGARAQIEKRDAPKSSE